MFETSTHGATRSRAKISSAACGSMLAALLLAGCGNNYRPVVTGTSPVGPASQPVKYAVAVSDPGSSQSGLVTFVDFSGDTVITQPAVQTAPNYIVLNGSAETTASYGYTINAAGTLSEFGVSSPNTLLTSQILTSTLPTTATPTNIASISLLNSTGTVFVPEVGANLLASLTTTGQLVQEIATPARPQYIVGMNSTPRIYVLNANNTASSIEANATTGLTLTSNITVGTNPVYGIMTSDLRRAFVVNKGSQTVSVINVVNNALDSTTPTITIPTVTDSGGNNISTNPVWADINPLTNELVVLSAGDGTHGGMVSVFNIPLCSAAAQASNPTCNADNPVDGTNFGTLVSTVPVGVNPTQLQVLRDSTTPRAYVANSGNGSTNGSVSVVNLNTGVVSATIPTVADSTTLSTPSIFGVHPSTLAVTTGSPTGKVYVTSTDSRYLTIIETDDDTVFTHAPIYGTGVRVVVTAP
ncbi:MAG: YncE family protein [Acidobacteriaceae bacterium]|nr:YncE family protein [Acidobacteriaceae bacterium]